MMEAPAPISAERLKELSLTISLPKVAVKKSNETVETDKK